MSVDLIQYGWKVTDNRYASCFVTAKGWWAQYKFNEWCSSPSGKPSYAFLERVDAELFIQNMSGQKTMRVVRARLKNPRRTDRVAISVSESYMSRFWLARLLESEYANAPKGTVMCDAVMLVHEQEEKEMSKPEIPELPKGMCDMSVDRQQIVAHFAARCKTLDRMILEHQTETHNDKHALETEIANNEQRIETLRKRLDDHDAHEHRRIQEAVTVAPEQPKPDDPFAKGKWVIYRGVLAEHVGKVGKIIPPRNVGEYQVEFQDGSTNDGCHNTALIPLDGTPEDCELEVGDEVEAGEMAYYGSGDKLPPKTRGIVFGISPRGILAIELSRPLKNCIGRVFVARSGARLTRRPPKGESK